MNDEAIAGDVARFLFLISTMNGRVESFMSAQRGEVGHELQIGRAAVMIGILGTTSYSL